MGTAGQDQAGLFSLDDVMRKADVSMKSLQAIANADGFSSLNIDRRQALWAARGLARHRLYDMPLFAHTGQRHERLAGIEPAIMLPSARLGENVAEDYSQPWSIVKSTSA